MYASKRGSWTCPRKSRSSRGTCGESATTCCARSRKVPCSASNSTSDSTISVAKVIRARKYGVVCTQSVIRKRSMPCTTTCSVLSGVRDTFWILAIVPVSYIWPGIGSSTAASGIPMRPRRRSPWSASSIKRIERGMPIARGMTENGYANVLRKGKIGRSLGIVVRRVVCSSGCIKLGIFLHPLWHMFVTVKAT